jgi:hypothetical protein
MGHLKSGTGSGPYEAFSILWLQYIISFYSTDVYHFLDHQHGKELSDVPKTLLKRCNSTQNARLAGPYNMGTTQASYSFLAFQEGSWPLWVDHCNDSPTPPSTQHPQGTQHALGRTMLTCHFHSYLFGNPDSWTDIHFKLKMHLGALQFGVIPKATQKFNLSKKCCQATLRWSWQSHKAHLLHAPESTHNCP